jgi:hypothetical protein
LDGVGYSIKWSFITCISGCFLIDKIIEKKKKEMTKEKNIFNNWRTIKQLRKDSA